MNKNKYKNGQIISEQINDKLYYYFKDGKIKAYGAFVNQKNGRYLAIL